MSNNKSKDHPEVSGIKNICDISPATSITKDVCDSINETSTTKENHSKSVKKSVRNKDTTSVNDSSNPGNKYNPQNKKPEHLEKTGFRKITKIIK